MPEISRWAFGDSPEPLRRCLEAGGVLAVPTESSYGLAADPGNRRGVEAIYRLKGRSAVKALPVIAGDLAQVLALGIDPDLPELTLLRQIWPAPLTAVLPVAGRLSAGAGRATLAVRIPAHLDIRGLLLDVGSAVTATSANLSGEPPVLDPEALEPLLSRADAAGVPMMVVDGGVLPGGPPSTLVRWREGRPEVLRHGAFDPASLPPLP
jgi:L-threonylcarbamoyladenylate synthase